MIPIPTVSFTRARYRGPGDPHKVNQFRNQLLYDMRRVHQFLDDQSNLLASEDKEAREAPVDALRRLNDLASHIRYLQRIVH